MEEKLRRLCWKTLRAGARSILVANIVDELDLVEYWQLLEEVLRLKLGDAMGAEIKRDRLAGILSFTSIYLQI